MSIKQCSRCHFAVVSKRRSCQICGNRDFNDKFVVRAKDADKGGVSTAVKSFAQEFANDVAETAEKSVRASRQIVRLILGRDVSREEERENDETAA